MKPLHPYKGKALACLMLLCLLLVQACRKDNLMPNGKDLQNGLSITEAKQFFNSNFPQSAGPKKLMSVNGAENKITFEDILAGKQPLWNQAYQKIIAGAATVKIPLDFGNAQMVVNSKKDEVVPFGALNYLFMYKDSLQKIRTEWVTLMPDSAWLYGNRATYTGSIIVKNWSGKLLKVYRFDESGPVTKASVISAKKLSSVNAIPTAPNNGADNTSGIKTICLKISNGRCPQLSPCSLYSCDLCLLKCAAIKCGLLIEGAVDEFDPNRPSDDGSDNGGGGGTSGPGGGKGGGYTPDDDCSKPTKIPVQTIGDETQMMAPGPPPCIPVPKNLAIVSSAIYLISFLDIPLDKQDFIVNNPFIAEALAEYLKANGETPENVEFVKWALDYLEQDPNQFNQAFKDLLNIQDDFNFDEIINPTDLDLNITTNLNPVFSVNGYEIFSSNLFQQDTYSETHPVSQKIIAYNPWIYRALIGANNTSVKHLHLISKGLAGADGYAKGIGAIGEGLFAERVTTQYPTSPGGNMYIGYYINSTHIDALQEHLLPKNGGMYYGLVVNYSDIEGNPLQQKMKYPDLNHNTTIEKGRIAYEIKTNSANRNTPKTLYETFTNGINQTVHRSKIIGIDAAVLVMDYDAWKKLLNSSYRQTVLDKLDEVYKIKNSKSEQKIFIRIEKNLWIDANKAYWDLLNKIKTL